MRIRLSQLVLTSAGAMLCVNWISTFLYLCSVEAETHQTYEIAKLLSFVFGLCVPGWVLATKLFTLADSTPQKTKKAQ